VEKYTKRFKNLRHLFVNDTTMTIFKCRHSHSHPTAATYRTAANTYLNEVVRKAGYIPYNVSQSVTDETDGTRLFYGEKDLSVPYRNDKVDTNHVIIMTDVDYYTDINKWLAFGNPLLLYTFTPKKCVGGTADYRYRLLEDEVEFVVAGGARYQHQLWDYVGDTCSVENEAGDRLVYNIEQRDIPGDEDHKFISFTPLASVQYPYGKYLGFKPQHIKRKKWTQNIDGNRVHWLYEPITDQLSLSRPGYWSSVELPGKVYDSINERIANKTAPPVISDVERLIRQADPALQQESARMAPLLFTLLGAKLKQNVVQTNGAISYLPIGSLATEDGKPMGRSISSPLVSDPALFPENSVASEEATVKGRIESLKNTTVPPRDYKNYREEFVKFLVPSASNGCPLSVDEVRRMQQAPQQRSRFQRCLGYLSEQLDNRLECFVKAEPYQSVNDPRNITTVSHALTVMLSTFTLAFKTDCLKRCHWFGPGLTPTKTARRLQRMAGDGFIVDDYSRMDGHGSEFSQGIIYEAYLRWVSPEHRAILKKYIDDVFTKRGRTKRGVQVEPGWSTRSGCPFTTDGNTLINAYVKFSAYRIMGYDSAQAWKYLSEDTILYGDDGAARYREGLSEAISEVCRKIGYKIKIDHIPDGKPVPYLGRYFCDPATSLDSFQDPMRTFAKLHLTPNKIVTEEQALVNKACGYWATDSKTPIITQWASNIRDKLGVRVKGATRDEQHKMSNAWPQRDETLIRASVAQVLDIEESELLELEDKVLKAPVGQLPVLFDTQREIKIPAVVDGELVEPATPLRNSRQVNNNVQRATAQRRLPQAARTQPGSTGQAGEGPDQETAPVRRTGQGRRGRTRPNRRRGQTARANSGPAQSRMAGRRQEQPRQLQS
jgi:hypothetical protein